MKRTIKHGLLVVSCIALLSGCMVTPTDISEATKLCSENSGLKGLRRDTFNKTLVVKCNNDAIFFIDR